MSRYFVHKFHTVGVLALFVVIAIILASPELDAQARSPRGQTIKAGSLPQDAANPLLLPPVLYDSGGYKAAFVVAADVNRDGILDLIVANQCASMADCSHGTIGVLLGKGDGTFQPAVTYNSGGYEAVALAVADVNGDGKPDVIVANEFGSSALTDGTVGVLLGNGDGTFQPVVIYGSGGYWTTGVAVRDLIGNGKQDIVTSSCDVDGGTGNCNGSGLGIVGVLLNKGDGTFNPAATYNLNQTLRTFGADGVAIGDVSGDGIADIVVGCYDKPSQIGALMVLFGNGDGTFTPWGGYAIAGSFARAPAIADLAGYGFLSVMGVSDAPSVGVVTVGLGGRILQQADMGLNGSNGGSVAAADLNGDGVQDIVVGDSGGVSVLYGNGSGDFPFAYQPDVIYPPVSSGFNVAAVGDFNGDNKPDVAITSQEENGDGAVAVLINNRQGPPFIGAKVSLVSSANPTLPKSVVTYTATVAPATGGPVTGTVTFQDISYYFGKFTVTTLAVVPLSGSPVSTSVYYPFKGNHEITASYSGDAVYGFSTSPYLNQYVGKLPVKTSMAVTSSKAHSIFGQAVTFSAFLSWFGGNVPDGEPVTFSDGLNPIGTSVTAGGVATITTSSLASGTHSIGASFAGNSPFEASHNKVSQVVTAAPVQTKTALVTSGSPSLSGQPVTFTATVTSEYGAIPDGEIVTFYDGARTMGTGPTSGGVASYTTSSLSVKTHTIKATYPGDATFKSSKATVTQVVNQSEGVEQIGPSPFPAQRGIAPATESPKAGNPLMSTNCGSSVNISSSGSPSLITDSVTFTGDVDMSTHCKGEYSPVCNGYVTFYDGKTQIGSILVDDKCQAISSQYLSAGKHRITGVYQPDGRGWRHSYAYLIQIVDKYPTIITLASSPNPSTFGEDVTLTVTVTTDEEDVPTGRVRFIDGTTTIGFATLDGNGVATLRKGKLPVGSNLITAEYLSDSTYASSTSAVLNQVVNP
jgi:hypothetical protein